MRHIRVAALKSVAACLPWLLPACLKVPVVDASTELAAPPATPPSAVLWEGRPPGELYAAGEVRGFRIEQGGQLIARSWGRYVGRDEAGYHRFETRIELLPPGMEPVRSEGLVRVDEQGDLVGGYERSPAVELRFSRQGDALSISDGSHTDDVAFDDGTAFVAHGALLHTELMLGMRRMAAGELSWRVVPLSGGPPFSWTAVVDTAPTEPGLPATIVTNLGERITVDDGRIIELVTEDAAQRVTPVRDPTWPAWTVEPPPTLSYRPPSDATFTITPLSIEGTPDEPTLAAELAVPPTATDKTPAPAVIFLPRMAGEDRHGFSGPPAADIGSHEIQDALAQAGFVVLRYDERGVGQSEAGAASYDAQVRDARRAYAMLLIQPIVDPARVIVIGHGEGALRALAIGAAEGKHLAGVALLASPGRRYPEVLRYQAQIRLAGSPPEIRRRALEEQDTMVAALVAGEPPPELAAHATWLSEIFAVNPERLIGRQRAPLLLVQGGKDFEVDPEADLGALISAAKRLRVKHRVARYPELDHLLKPEPGVSKPERYREDRRVDPKFLADLVAWARNVTAP